MRIVPGSKRKSRIGSEDKRTSRIVSEGKRNSRAIVFEDKSKSSVSIRIKANRG